MATTKKGVIETVFKDAIATKKGLSSPSPEQNNKSGKK